ncbi:MAG: FlgD immunoglobulin-like domain containing protein [bacterium]
MKARLIGILLIVLGIVISFSEISKAAPLPPTNLTASNNEGPIDLTWDAVSGILISYEIYRDTSSTVTTSSLLIGDITPPEGTDPIAYTDTNTVDGTTYYYAVRAVENFPFYDPSALSDTASATANFPPSAPTNLTATLVNRGINLAWNPVTGMVYNVYRNIFPGITKSSPRIVIQTSATSYRDTAVSNGQTYYYAVTAVDPGDLTESDVSNEASATSIFNPPSNLAAVNNLGPIDLSWSATTGFGTITYNVYRNTALDFATSSRIRTGEINTFWTDSGTVDGTLYYYWVSGVDSADGLESPPSTEAWAVSNWPPPAPTGVTAATVGRAVYIDWNTVSGMVYNVYRATSAGVNKSSPRVADEISETEFLDTTVTVGQTYYYVVTSVDPADPDPLARESDISSEVSATSIFTPPSNLSAANAKGPISLSWTGTSGLGTITYNVYRSDTSSAAASSRIASGVTGTTYLDEGTLDGVTYYYWVSAVDSFDGLESNASGMAQATALYPPPTPSGLEATDKDSQGRPLSRRVRLIWEGVTREGEVVTYRVYRHTSSPVPVDLAHRVAQQLQNPSYIDNPPADETPYFYVVTSFTSYRGESDPSNWVGGMSHFIPPSNLEAENDRGQINLTWEKTSGQGGMVTYNVYRSTSIGVTPDPVNLVKSSLWGTTWSDGNTEDQVTYYYIVTAVDSADGAESPSSNEASAKAVYPASPTAPSDLATKTEKRQIVLTWTASQLQGGSEGPVTYRVYRSRTRPVEVNDTNLLVQGLTTTTYTDFDVENKTIYWYVVTAVDESSSLVSKPGGPVMGISFFEPPSKLKATNQTGEGEEGQIKLEWTKTEGIGLVTYNVYRSSPRVPTPILKVSGLMNPQWTDIDTANNARYCYQVTAVDSFDNLESDPSNLSCATSYHKQSVSNITVYPSIIDYETNGPAGEPNQLEYTTITLDVNAGPTDSDGNISTVKKLIIKITDVGITAAPTAAVFQMYNLSTGTYDLNWDGEWTELEAGECSPIKHNSVYGVTACVVNHNDAESLQIETGPIIGVDVVHVQGGVKIIYQEVGDMPPAHVPPFKFEYRLTKDAYVTFRFYDTNNTAENLGDDILVKTIVHETPRPGELASRDFKNIDIWDGKGDEGRIVPNGIYRVAIDAIERRFNPGTDMAYGWTGVNTTVAVDILRILDLDVTGISADNPLAEIRYILSGSGFAEGGTGGGMEVTLNIYEPGTTVDVDGNATGGVMVKSFTFYQNQGQNFIVWNGLDEDNVLLPNGNYVFTISAKDTYGNLALDREGNDGPLHGTIPVDRTPDQEPPDVTSPVVVSTEPANGEVINFTISEVLAQLSDEVGGSGLNLAKSSLTLTGPDGQPVTGIQSNNGIDTIRLRFNEQTDTGLYTLKVIAVDNAGNESKAKIVTFTLTDEFIPPSALTGLALEGGYIQLSWTSAVGQGEITYRIYRALTSSEVVKASNLVDSGITITTWTDGKIEGGVKYYYAVTAVDASEQESEPSATVSVMAPFPPAIPTPFNLKAEALAEGPIKLSWEISADTPGVLTYNIYRSTSVIDELDTDNLVASGVQATEWTDYQTVNNGTYFYRVAVIDPISEEIGYPSNLAFAKSYYPQAVNLSIKNPIIDYESNGVPTFAVIMLDVINGPAKKVEITITDTLGDEVADKMEVYNVTQSRAKDVTTLEPMNHIRNYQWYNYKSAWDETKSPLVYINGIQTTKSYQIYPQFGYVRFDEPNQSADVVAITGLTYYEGAATWDGTWDEGVGIKHNSTYKVEAKVTNYNDEVSEIYSVDNYIMVDVVHVQKVELEYQQVGDIMEAHVPPYTITYALTKNARTTIEIRNKETEETVKTIIHKTPRLGEYLNRDRTNSDVWDGKDDSGRIVPNGVYGFTIRAEWKDPADPYLDMGEWVSAEGIAVDLLRILDVTVSGITPTSCKSEIKYTLTGSGFGGGGTSGGMEVTIKIYTPGTTISSEGVVSGGELVKTISGFRNLGGNTETWDGRNEKGDFLPAGIYVFTIEAKDGYGNKALDAEGNDRPMHGNIPVDRKLEIVGLSVQDIGEGNPQAKFTYTLAGSGLELSGDEITVIINIYDSAAVIHTDGSVTGGRLIRNLTFTHGLGEQIDIWDGRDGSGVSVNNGTYLFTITAVAPGGNLKDWKQGEIMVEREPAEIQISNLSVKGISGQSDLAEITYTLEVKGLYIVGDEIKVDIDIYEPGTTIGADGIATGGVLVRSLSFDRGVGPQTDQWNGLDNTGKRVANGLYPFTIKAAVQGVETWTKGSISIYWEGPEGPADTTDPVIVYTIPAEGATLTAYISEVSAYLQDEPGGSGIDLKASSISLRDSKGNLISGTKETDSAGTITFRPYSEQSTPGKYTMEVTAVDKAGNQETKAVQFTLSEEAVSVRGLQEVYAYPNPAKKQSKVYIHYELPSPARVTVKIFTLMGDLVREMEVGEQGAGEYSQAWNLENDEGDLVSSGAYIYTIEATGMDMVKGKMVIIR